MKALWQNTVVAESERTVVVEGNHYFPPESIKREFFQASDTHSTCPWKGRASYYDVRLSAHVNKDAACTIRSQTKRPDRSKVTLRFGAE